MVHITSVALFDAQRGKETVVLLLEYNKNVKKSEIEILEAKTKKGLVWPGIEPVTFGLEGQNSTYTPP